MPNFSPLHGSSWHISEVPPADFDGRSRFKTGNWKAVTPLRL
jgi:hypothetical protein